MAKRSCNFFDVNNIREFVEAGNTDAGQIGQRLNIAPATVQKFVDTMVRPSEVPATENEDDSSEHTNQAGREQAQEGRHRRRAGNGSSSE